MKTVRSNLVLVGEIERNNLITGQVKGDFDSIVNCQLEYWNIGIWNWRMSNGNSNT